MRACEFPWAPQREKYLKPAPTKGSKPSSKRGLGGGAGVLARGVDHTGGDAVHGDAARGEVVREGAGEAADVDHGGVVDENVEVAEAPGDGGDHGIDFGALGGAGAHQQRLAAWCGDFVYDGLAFARTGANIDGDRCAFACEGECDSDSDSAADVAARAGDQGHSSRKR